MNVCHTCNKCLNPACCTNPCEHLLPRPKPSEGGGWLIAIAISMAFWTLVFTLIDIASRK